MQCLCCFYFYTTKKSQFFLLLIYYIHIDFLTNFILTWLLTFSTLGKISRPQIDMFFFLFVFFLFPPKIGFDFFVYFLSPFQDEIRKKHLKHYLMLFCIQSSRSY